MRNRMVVLAALASMAAAPAPDAEDGPAPIPHGFYRLASAVRVAGPSPDWDYLAFDPARGRLFIARHDAGLWVFDTNTNRMLRRIANSAGAGATVLVPSRNRGFSTNKDGSTTVFNLATLATIRRVTFAEDADSASFDPVTGRLAFVSPDSHRVTLVDARRLAVVGHIDLTARKLDASVADGRGGILVNERDRAMVARIDARSLTLTAEWPTPGCAQPTGMALDAATRRAFLGCRGDHPVLAVLDADQGTVITTLPLGRGNDGVVFDPARKRIIATNGIEANITLYRQQDADHYTLAQAISTRPEARTLAYDPRRARIFTVTAEGVLNPAAKANSGPSPFYPNAYWANSLVVLTYAPDGGRSGGGR